MLLRWIGVMILLFGSVIASAVTFRDFSGACQGGGDGTLVGWNRIDISWVSAEPEAGRYDEAYLNKIYLDIRKNLEQGVKVLPMIGYAPGWASRGGEYVFTRGDSRRVYTKLAGNEYLMRELIRNKKGKWIPKTGKDGKNIETRVRSPQIPLAPENIEKWQAFVRRVVSDLRKKPYNLEYFQIWNEAHPASGFYNGELREYLTNVHLPAARAIRELGGKVVYGGFPCCGTVDHLARELTETDAWKSLDVIDIHYFPEWCMEYLRDQAAKNGRPDIGVWQTEIIFHNNYYAVAQIYPNVLYWGLTHDWRYADRYKLFFFAYGSPDDPKAYGYGKCLVSGKELSPHGRALKTLVDLFGDDQLTAYDRIVSRPKLEFANRGDRIAGFRFGNKILVAVNLDSGTREQQENEKIETMRLAFPGIKRDSVIRATRIGIFGERRPLVLRNASTGVTVEVPLLEEADNRYADKLLKEKSLRRPVFYTLLELK